MKPLKRLAELNSEDLKMYRTLRSNLETDVFNDYFDEFLQRIARVKSLCEHPTEDVYEEIDKINDEDLKLFDFLWPIHTETFWKNMYQTLSDWGARILEVGEIVHEFSNQLIPTL